MEEKQSFNLNLNVDEINIILNGLVQLPYKNVAVVIDKIKFQVNEQIKISKERKK